MSSFSSLLYPPLAFLSSLVVVVVAAFVVLCFFWEPEKKRQYPPIICFLLRKENLLVDVFCGCLCFWFIVPYLDAFVVWVSQFVVL